MKKWIINVGLALATAGLLAFAMSSLGAVTDTSNGRRDTIGDGSTLAFTFTFPAQKTSDIEVYLDSVRQTTGFTITLASTVGGTVTFVAAPPLNTPVRIQRTIPLKQETVSPSSAKITEKMADRIVMQGQQIDRKVNDLEAAVVAAGITPSGDGSNVMVKSNRSSVSRSEKDRWAETINVKDYGAAGNGLIDDTGAVQAALDEAAITGGVVVGNPGETYLVSYAGTKTWAATPQRYALSIASYVTLDLRESTIELAAAQNAAVLINSSAGTGQDSDITIRNGTLDGSRSTQTNPATGDMPVIFMYGVARPRVENLTVVEARQYSGRFLGIEDGRFRGLTALGSDGDCWSFGVDTVYLVKRSQIDDVYATACIGTIGGGYPLGTMQGNPVIFTVQHTQVGKVVGKDSYGGIKIQNSSYASTFESLEFIGSTIVGSDNSGTKVQGYPAGGLYPDLITIISARSTDARGPGLYLNDTRRVHVVSYQGLRNNWGGLYVDMWIDSSAAKIDSVYIASTQSSSASTVRATHAVWPVEIISMDVEDIGTKTGSGGMSVQAGTITRIGSFTVKDTRASPFMASGINYNEGDAILDVQNLTTVGVAIGLNKNTEPTTGRALVFNATPTAPTFTSTAEAGMDAFFAVTGARIRVGSNYWDTTANTWRTPNSLRAGTYFTSSVDGVNRHFGNATDGASSYAHKFGNETTLAQGFIAGFYSDNLASELRANIDVVGHLRISIGNTSACPTCNSSSRGTFCYVGGGAGVKDTVQVCAKDGADAYAWRTIY